MTDTTPKFSVGGTAIAGVVALALMFGGNGGVDTPEKSDDKHYVKVFFAYSPRPTPRPWAGLEVVINGHSYRPNGINKAQRVRKTDPWLGVWNTFGPFDEVHSVEAMIVTTPSRGTDPRPVKCRIYIDDALKPADESPAGTIGSARCHVPRRR
jgi:hypothetical protein